MTWTAKRDDVARWLATGKAPCAPGDVEHELSGGLGEIERLCVENAEVRGLLRRLVDGPQWDMHIRGGMTTLFCPWCDAAYPEHAEDCPYAAAEKYLEGGK